jgi:ABC-type multidrug transport system fused ATPase/permease subunit
VDLASQCSDDEIWKVLDMIEMRQYIIDLPHMLDTQVAEGDVSYYYSLTILLLITAMK